MFTRREDVPRFARMVPLAEIEKNDYNLNLPRYIDGQTPEDVQDIAGHLRGGIPVRDVDALADYWAVCPALRSALFRDHRPGYVDLAADKAGIKAAIFGHPEFETFVAGMHAHFDAWRTTAAADTPGARSRGTTRSRSSAISPRGCSGTTTVGRSSTRTPSTST